jgi:hypothetical protein
MSWMGYHQVLMLGRCTDRRARFLGFAGLALYAVFLVASPFEHHDLLCELKTPQHCTACTSSVVGADPHEVAVPGILQLTDAGRAVALQVLALDTLLAVRSTGRSPPVHL